MGTSHLIGNQFWGRLSGDQGLQVFGYTLNGKKSNIAYRSDHNIDIFALLQKQRHLGCDELL